MADHAAEDLREAPPHRAGRQRSWLWEVVEAILIALVFAIFVRTWVFQAVKIPTGSMEENLLVGDRILVNKFIYGPVVDPRETRYLPLRRVHRGDVVVFKYPENPERDFIKRCVGLPGDEIDIVRKQLRINGHPLDEGYVFHQDPDIYPDSQFVPEYYRKRDNFGPYVVPPGHYFCLGDNRDNSHDSRFWGPVPSTYVKGRALLVYASVDRLSGPVSTEERPWWQVGPLDPDFRARIRWARIFQLVR